MNLDPNTSLSIMQAAQGGANNAINATKNVTNKDAVSKIKDDKLDVVAKDFEAMFVTEMMKPMFEQIKPNKMFGGGKGEEIFSGMMLQEYGKMMAETGQIGIATSVKAELIRMQGEELDLTQEAEGQTQTADNTLDNQTGEDALNTIINNTANSTTISVE